MADRKVQGVVLTRDEMLARTSAIRAGESPERVSQRIGGEPYERNSVGGRTRYSWLIEVSDATPVEGRRQIYMGEFEKGALVAGWILPNG